MTEDEAPAFSPPSGFPQNPEFYRRVLDEWPSPMLVVNDLGQVIYGNRAMGELGGWDLHESVGSSVLDYVHPDDVSMLTEAFFELAGNSHSQAFEVGMPWASIHFRLVAANGQPIPVRVTGSGGLQDPAVGGIIYDVRPAHEQDILRRGLTGLAEGEPIDAILGLIADMIALPPLDLEAAVLESRSDGSYRVIGATDPRLDEILGRAHDPMPWNASSRTPRHTLVARFPGGVGEDLFAAGFRDFWHVAPEASPGNDSYRIVACTPTIHRPAVGPVDRLKRANELASVVLLRARADALLEYSATHDRLTQLPNREGFYRRAGEALSSSTAESAALLFLDLDGFKAVNDQHGHAAGDLVLETIGARLRSVTRSIDLVARFGGDEFVILIGSTPDRPASRERVEVVADRALELVTEPIEIGDGRVRVAASIGAVVAAIPTEIEDLLAGADAAMYQAKRAGGHRHNIVGG